MQSTTPLAPSLEEEVEPATAAFYRRALRTLADAGVPFLVGGAFAHACYTGIRRSTKDLDLFISGARTTTGWRNRCRRRAGARKIAFPHWLAKVYEGEEFIDLIFNSGNGVAPRGRPLVPRQRRGRDPGRAGGHRQPSRTGCCRRPSSWERSATTAPTSPTWLQVNAERLDWPACCGASARTGACCSRT